MHKALLLSITLILTFSSSFAEETWKAGAASITITPGNDLWMAGYGARTAPAEGTGTDLHAKALLLEDASGHQGLIITMDLVGIGRDLARRITDELHKAHGLAREQITLCTSHTHSGPVVGQNLAPLHYESLDPEQQAKIRAYADELVQKVVTLSGEAYAHLAPATLQSGSGKCTFAVNRRENKPETEVPARRASGTLKGPVDHDVPVLSVRSKTGELQAVLFGYACHATVLSGQVWSADYPGYAQTALETAFPGAIALFWAGCGGDQNPIPRREIPLAEKYGAELAARVGDVLNSPMPVLAPSLSTTYEEISASLAPLPTTEQIKANTTSTNRFEVARARYLLKKLEKQGPLEAFYPYPIAVWKLGKEIDFIFLGGETVVDLALRLKREGRGTSTWVAGYSNDVMAYIPSLRVRKEGGYEGGESHVYYGLPSLWAETIEDEIISAAERLTK